MDELIKLTEGAEDDDELLKQLIDDDDISPFFMQPHQPIEPISGLTSDFGLLAGIYSGPTIQDTESALSYADYDINDLNHEAKSDDDGISVHERSYNLNKDNHENCKYTLRIKICGNVIDDDGYKWRKYGQKSIKNSPNPRSYYRCTNPRCNAKKQVERSIEDQDTLIITYEGLHLHFIYPFFDNNTAGPPIKKRKGPISEAQHEAHHFVAQTAEINMDSTSQMDPTQEFGQEPVGPQGLLEDMVPLMIRQPLIDSTSSSSSSLGACSS